MGAAESSSTTAMLLVPDGAPVQPSGGLGAWGTPQVKRIGITLPTNSPLLTPITLGVAISLSEPNSPQPDTGNAQHSATTAAASDRAPRRRTAGRRREGRPRARYTRTSAADDIGCRQRPGILITATSAYALRNACWPVSAWPSTRVCISVVPS